MYLEGNGAGLVKSDVCTRTFVSNAAPESPFMDLIDKSKWIDLANAIDIGTLFPGER